MEMTTNVEMPWAAAALGEMAATSMPKRRAGGGGAQANRKQCTDVLENLEAEKDVASEKHRGNLHQTEDHAEEKPGAENVSGPHRRR